MPSSQPPTNSSGRHAVRSQLLGLGGGGGGGLRRDGPQGEPPAPPPSGFAERARGAWARARAWAELAGCLWALWRGRAAPAAAVSVDTGRDSGFGTRHGTGGAGAWTVHVDGSVDASGGAAGAGGFYGDGDARNWAECLGQSCPDSNRAELAAIYICLLRAPRSATLTVLSDSAYALRRLQASVREGGLPAGWRSGPSGVLLAGTAALLFLRRAPTRLRKVQGHGRSSANAAADGLAALGRARAARGNPPGAVPGLTASPFSAAVRAQWARFLPS